jgi:hypothetical protein
VLPALAVLLVLRLRRDPGDQASFLLLLMVASLIATIVAAAIGCYDESARLRAPMDWVVIVVAGIVLYDLVSRAWPAGRARMMDAARAGSRNAPFIHP